MQAIKCVLFAYNIPVHFVSSAQPAIVIVKQCNICIFGEQYYIPPHSELKNCSHSVFSIIIKLNPGHGQFHSYFVMVWFHKAVSVGAITFGILWKSIYSLRL